MKRLRALELGINVPELPEKPLKYHCKSDPDVSKGFLLTLEEISRVAHWVSDSKQRYAILLLLAECLVQCTLVFGNGDRALVMFNLLSGTCWRHIVALCGALESMLSALRACLLWKAGRMVPLYVPAHSFIALYTAVLTILDAHCLAVGCCWRSMASN